MSLKNTQLISLLKTRLHNFENRIQTEEIGSVVCMSDGVALIEGLDYAFNGELIKFDSGALGVVQNLSVDSVGVVVFTDQDSVSEGMLAKRTKEFMNVPVGMGLLGRVVDGVGRPIDGKGPLSDVKYMPIMREAPSIIERKSVSKPLHTGIMLIDSLIPIGKGQRELIIGDRQIGKTAIVMDTILHQRHIHESSTLEDEKVYCIYVAIGQKMSTIARFVRTLEDHGAMRYSTVVCASAYDSAAMQYFAPYTGCTIGEFFRDSKRHAMIAYDDLSKHAIAYREMSLLLRRPPGREAYPGDVFYIHSKLLERAASVKDGGTLTAIPIIETQSGDVSAYIPTNVISITDGQIILETDMFYKGIRPAINIGLSVSRIGSAAQTKGMKEAAGKTKISLAQHREMKHFAQFASDLDISTQKLLDRGERLMEMLKQSQMQTRDINDQIISLFAMNEGCFDNIPINQIKLIMHQINALSIEGGADLHKGLTEESKQKIRDFVKAKAEQ